MRYVDGYVLPVPKRKLARYRTLARAAGKIWIKHGALEYVECAGDDLISVKQWGGFPFPKMAKTKKGETVIFAFIIYKSRAHRDRVNAKVHKEMEADKEKYKDINMPFDYKRMAFGGFEAIVDYISKK